MLPGLRTTLVDHVAVTERRRVVVAVGVPLLFWLAAELGANLGVLPLALAAGLAAYLYSRDTARKTLAASALGTGILVLALFALQLYLGVSGGSTESLAAAVQRLAAWPIAGIVLLALGAWLHADAATAPRETAP